MNIPARSHLIRRGKLLVLVIGVLCAFPQFSSYARESTAPEVQSEISLEGTNIAAGCPVIARGGGVTYAPWGNANDSLDYNTTTNPTGGRWGVETNTGNGTFEVVDLGGVYDLTGVGYHLDWDSAYVNPLTFQVAVSLDNVTWTVVSEIVHPYNTSPGASVVNQDVGVTPIAARYVRYWEPPDGQWNGWGDFFHLRAYSLTPSSTCGTVPTPTSTVTLLPSPTETWVSPTPSMTASPTSTVTELPTNTSTFTPTWTPTRTVTRTPTPYVSRTPTRTRTPSVTPSPTSTGTITATYTPSPTRTRTATRTPTPYISRTPTRTRTPSVTPSPTSTGAITATYTPTWTPTRTVTRTPTPYISRTPTPTRTPSVTPSMSPSPSFTPTAIPPVSGTNIAAGCPVIARGGGVTYAPWGNANDSVDYNTTTNPTEGRWGVETNTGNGTFEVVDLGGVYDLTGVGYHLDWDSAYVNPLTFQVAVSLDNVTWTVVSEIVHPYNTSPGASVVNQDVGLTSVAARYVRYWEPPDGQWNGWGDFFHLRAYSLTPSSTCGSVPTPTSTVTLLPSPTETWVSPTPSMTASPTSTVTELPTSTSTLTSTPTLLPTFTPSQIPTETPTITE